MHFNGSRRPVSFNGRPAGIVQPHYVMPGDSHKPRAKVNSSKVSEKKAEKLDGTLKALFLVLVIAIVAVGFGTVTGTKWLQLGSFVTVLVDAFLVTVRNRQIQDLKARAGIPAES